MKLLHVLPTLSGGGAESVVAHLLIGCTERGIECQLTLLAGVRGERGGHLLHKLQNAGVGVSGIRSRSIKSPANLYRLYSIWRQFRPDIIQANLPAAELLVAMLRPVFRDTQYVRRFASTRIGGWHPLAERLGLGRFFDATVACSGSVRAAMGTPSTVVIPNGVHPAFRPPTREERLKTRTRLGLEEHEKVVLHVGRMWPEPGHANDLSKAPKGHDTLLAAFSNARRDIPEGKLLLVGDGPLRSAIERLSNSLGVHRHVRFLGEQVDVRPAMWASDAFVFPSRREGMPNSILEAAATGLIIVASDIPAISSLPGSDFWHLCPVDDLQAFSNALRQVLSPELLGLSPLHCQSKEVRGAVGLSQSVQRYIDLYQSLHWEPDACD